MCHFFIYRIPHGECTTVFCEIEELNFSMQSWTSGTKASILYAVLNKIYMQRKHERRIVNTESCEPQLHQKTYSFHSITAGLTDSDKCAQTSLVLYAHTSTCVGIGTN